MGRVERLLAAISWLDDPFVCASTPLDEIWRRIHFMRQDRDAAMRAPDQPTPKEHEG